MKATLCNVCGKRRVGTTGQDPLSAKLAGQCGLCMDEGGWENTHNDGDHEAVQASLEDVEYGKTNHKSEAEYLNWKKSQEAEVAGCWICYPALNEAANWKPGKPKTAKPAGKATYVRRTQLNHKTMCTHPQLPKARRTCKEAFWAGVKVMMTEGNLTEDQAWEHCIAQLAPGTVQPTAERKLAEQAGIVKPVKVPGEVNGTPFTVVKSGPKGGVVKQTKAAKPKPETFPGVPKNCTCVWNETKPGSGQWKLVKDNAKCPAHKIGSYTAKGLGIIS